MSLIPAVTLARPPTPDPFWDVAIRFLGGDDSSLPQNNGSGGDGYYNIYGPFNPITGQHDGDGHGIPEIVWPGPPSPGFGPTPMDHVLISGWGQPNGDRLLYMTGDEVEYHNDLPLVSWSTPSSISSPLSPSSISTPPYQPIRTGLLESVTSDDSMSDDELLVTPLESTEELNGRIDRLEEDLAMFMERMEAMRERLRELLEM
ncbi:hypothetical protein BDV93DRAFT_565795 [Ceratobasidium sp. AG-I]|nr:hypothetical protein BDV93DRAFT_565795 [Ceratobasidium sp. AG-I]